MRTTIRTTIVAIAAAAAAAGVAAPASAAVPASPPELSALCAAHGGSFHVNTHDGVNWICSAPHHRGDFAAERAVCRHVGGVFGQTQVVDGRSSWFCHTGE